MPSTTVISPIAVGDKALPVRQKRHQVITACDNCRKRKEKCNDARPCQNCTRRGVTCSQSTEPSAVDQIECLKRENSLLKQEVEHMKRRLQQFQALGRKEAIPKLGDTHIISGTPLATPRESAIDNQLTMNVLRQNAFSFEIILREEAIQEPSV